MIISSLLQFLKRNDEFEKSDRKNGKGHGFERCLGSKIGFLIRGVRWEREREEWRGSRMVGWEDTGSGWCSLWSEMIQSEKEACCEDGNVHKPCMSIKWKGNWHEVVIGINSLT